MPEFPSIAHVALTVTSLERSVPWYKALFGSDPILDQDTGPFQRVAWLTSGTLVGLTQFPIWTARSRSASAGRVSIICRSAAPTAMS